IDPLDGTCNFSTGIPMYGVQMAVFKNKEVVASIIYLPRTDEVFKAVKDMGVTLNGKRLLLNKNIRQEESVLILSDFYPDIEIEHEKQYKLAQLLQSHFLKTRLFGAACFDFAALATSKAQAYICYYHEIWDIAPGLLIVQELGMKVEGFDRPYVLGDSAMIVALTDSIITDIKKMYSRI
ncbi:MAG: hypothetical protein K2H85_11170, partial [Allobaculum sp.]|nr:hypothetical protein [Allobaculum sp.]